MKIHNQYEELQVIRQEYAGEDEPRNPGLSDASNHEEYPPLRESERLAKSRKASGKSKTKTRNNPIDEYIDAIVEELDKKDIVRKRNVPDGSASCGQCPSTVATWESTVVTSGSPGGGRGAAEEELMKPGRQVKNFVNATKAKEVAQDRARKRVQVLSGVSVVKKEQRRFFKTPLKEKEGVDVCEDCVATVGDNKLGRIQLSEGLVANLMDARHPKMKTPSSWSDETMTMTTTMVMVPECHAETLA